jgi:5-methylcytosine-specific restriction endonuclease McrA
MPGLIQHREEHKIPPGAARSGKWPAARRAWLKKHPRCFVCEGTKKVEVHHIHPFHLHPQLELEPSNFITLCENQKDGINCHLAFGHLGNFKSYNVNVRKDAAIWRVKIATRPKLVTKRK